MPGGRCPEQPGLGDGEHPLWTGRGSPQGAGRVAAGPGLCFKWLILTSYGMSVRSFVAILMLSLRLGKTPWSMCERVCVKTSPGDRG